jgi:hypothetical protein
MPKPLSYAEATEKLNPVTPQEKVPHDEHLLPVKATRGVYQQDERAVPCLQGEV